MGTDEQMEQLVEPAEPTQKGKAPAEKTEAIRAWGLEDSAPAVKQYKAPKAAVQPNLVEPETRTWSETFRIIGKYGAVATLAAMVVLMFLHDHLPHNQSAPPSPYANFTPTLSPPPSPIDQEPTGQTGPFPVPSTVAEAAPPPPVTVTKTEPPPEPPPPPPVTEPPTRWADVNPETLSTFYALLAGDGLRSTDSVPQLTQEVQVNCHAAQRGNLSRAIQLTRDGNNLPPGGAEAMIHDTIQAFCPQYG